MLLGDIIERVAGKPYEVFVAEEVYAAIQGNQNISFAGDTDNLAKGYHPRRHWMNIVLPYLMDTKAFLGRAESGKWRAVNPYFVNGSAYGGIQTSAPALASFAMSILNNRFNISQKDAIFNPFTLNSGKKSEITEWGWFSGKLKGHQYVCHAGGGSGFYSELRLYPNLNMGSVLLMNRTGMKDLRLLNQFDQEIIS